MTRLLLTKSWLEENSPNLEAWQRNAFIEFSNTIADKDNTYPCVPGRQGFLMNHLRFGFLGDPREASTASKMAEIIKEYGQCSRNTGKYASLVLLFETPEDLKESYLVEDYEQLFWTLLNEVSKHDQKDWPEEISKDPNHFSWEYCFGGEPYFAFCATPAHYNRKSRHFSSFLIALQPRWVFEEINDSTEFGRKMKKLIRQRLLDYDGIPAHPTLKWYGQQDNHEWKQYFLRDDESTLSKCPFSRFMSLIKKK
jgi:uncharacterized protein